MSHETGAKRRNSLTASDAEAKWRSFQDTFPDGNPLASVVEPVNEACVPEPYRTLLVHTQFMTATMERFHGSSVDVKVLARKLDTDQAVYRRKIVLLAKETDAVVQFAFMQFNLGSVSETVRQEILSEQVPLGRVLMTHKINSEIELRDLLKLTVGKGLSDLFGTPVDQVTYGRIARIFCDGALAFEVIEVSTPTDRRLA